MSKEGVLVFDNTGKREVARKGNITEKEIRAGQALQQVTFQDFIEK